MKDIGYGKAYQYSHDYDNNFVHQEYLPNEIKNTKFYEPSENSKEKEIRKFLSFLWKGKYGY